MLQFITSAHKTLLEVVAWATVIVSALIGLLLGAIVQQGFLGLLLGAAWGFIVVVVAIGTAASLARMAEDIAAIRAAAEKK
jgi:F0F1-type ATP synthase assembly protein I